MITSWARNGLKRSREKTPRILPEKGWRAFSITTEPLSFATRRKLSQSRGQGELFVPPLMKLNDAVRRLMIEECVILADSPSALIELCGISALERLLRTLQTCEFKSAIILSSTPDSIEQYLRRASRF